MTKPKVAIVLGTTRQGRFCERPAAWIESLASRRPEATYERVDLRDHPLPFFDEPASPASVAPRNEVAQHWARTVDSFDAFIFLTAEYNHGPSAVLKNALDYAYKEFNRKPVAFVGYGGVGAARAVEQLRLVTIELQMAPVRNAVHIGLAEYLGIVQQGKSFNDFPHLEKSALTMFADLAWWTSALCLARTRP